MDRNSVIGLLLIGAIMVAFTVMNQPDREALEKEKSEQVIKDSIEAVKNSEAKAVAANSPTKTDTGKSAETSSARFGTFAGAGSGNEEDFILENESVKITVSSKGGTPKQIELKKFQTWEKQNLNLFEADSSRFSFSLPAESANIETAELYFEKNNQSTNDKLILVCQVDSIHSFQYAYELQPEGYNFSFNADFKNLGNLIDRNLKGLPLNIHYTGKRQEKNVQNERNNTTIYYRDLQEGDVDKLSPLESSTEQVEKSLEWIAFKEQFFTLALIAENGIETGANLSTSTPTTGDIYTKSMQADIRLLTSAGNPTVALNFFSGPTQYNLLKDQGHDLHNLIPLGWGIFGWVNKIIVIPAFKFLGKFNLGYGLVILLLTIYIKLILLAFQYRSYLSQAKMRVLKPEIDEINKQYADGDAMQKQQAVMGLYREAGVNPLGGCLPMIFQIPVLFAMFSFFPAAIELRQKGFLWADDLSTYDSIIDLPFDVPFYGDHVSLFALLMTISTILYTRMNNQLSAGSSEMMPGLKWMMYLMPVIFLFVLNSYAAGLNYYYFLANIITFAQQFAFRKFVDDKKIHEKIQQKKNQPKKASKSSFQQRLEEMAKAKQAGRK